MRPEAIRIERNGDVYVARANDAIIWTVELRLNMAGTPFREEIVWPPAAVIAIGGGDAVHFVRSETGAIMKTLALENDFFGHFGDPNCSVLFILGWRNVVAVDRGLNIRWTSRDVAVDGIIWRGTQGDRILLSAEMDPPGGWVNVELDANTGREVARDSSSSTGPST